MHAKDSYHFVAPVIFVILTLLVVISALTLASGGPVEEIVLKFESYTRILKPAILISTLVLVLLSNIKYWKWGKKVYFFLTFLFFCLFEGVYWFYLAESYFIFRKTNDLWDGGFSVNYIIGIVYIFVGAFVMMINWLLIRNAAKMKNRAL